MFDNKNFSVRQLSLIAAAILSVAIALLFYLLNRSWTGSLAVLVIVFSGSYFLVKYILQQFIYRKIKLIYKLIYQTKATRKEEMYQKYLLPRQEIEDVEEEVEKWAIQQSGELEFLRSNEIFRREFLQNLSHEFKTPVFAIQGYMDILLQQEGQQSATRKYLEKASRNVQRLTNLIKDLDEISKLERGELKLHPQYFVIQDIVKEAFDAVSLKAEEKEISFSIKKGCDQPLLVYADRDKIRQVLVNLIDNAIKYGKEEGSVVASMYNIDEKNILVEISDDGIGIPEKHLDRIFERFYRTAEGRSRDMTGSGLGLSICKHIIEAHRHSIHVRSKENVGTTIGFTLSSSRE